MQSDGNAVLYSGGTPLWWTRTHGNPGSFIVVQSDGNLVVYRPDGRAIFNTNTVQGSGGGGGSLGVSFSENPYRCDNGVRPFGTITGAARGERINFTSPGLSLLSGTANGAGNLTIQWQCTPSEAGRSWSVTARGATSGRTVTFSVTGAAAGAPPGGGGGGPAVADLAVTRAVAPVLLAL